MDVCKELKMLKAEINKNPKIWAAKKTNIILNCHILSDFSLVAQKVPTYLMLAYL
jgi:hypothetical protein